MDTLLITGGTGTFGHAFVRRVLDDNLFKRVAVLSRDEKKQADMAGEFDDPRLRFYLGDVRDRERLERAFQGVDAVVHAASYKRLERSGTDADEFFKTICLGALNVVEAAHRVGVGKAVALSTDKAVESATPYGSFKSAAEHLFVAGNAWGPARFSLCRYGNILNSRGSVLEIWREKMACGLPLPVTDPGMTRFWLTIEQAVDLVLLALGRMRGGEIFIPKDVQRSSVLDLARAWYLTAEVEVVGKRSYEKMHEVLVADEERDRLRDCGDCYVLLPMHVRWEPRPYGENMPGVGADFQYRSDG